MKAVTLGPAGTYSHRAAEAVADGVDFRESVTAIVEAVARGEYDRGVVPIENSIEGSVTETLDALADRGHEAQSAGDGATGERNGPGGVAVVKEIVTPIRHALLARDEDFEVVASHSQALAQCRSYLEEHYPDVDREAVASTARGVEHARADPSVAAIGHPANAAEGDDDLRIVAEDIQDRDSNATRFFVLAPVADRSEAGAKSSIIVYPNANYPGLLLELLEPFADRDINLTRVESRPSGERLGDYVFHVDVAAGLYEERTADALEVIEAISEDGWVRRLGSYDTETVLY